MKSIKRKKYLVSKPVQFRYMGIVAVPLLVLLSGLYYLIYYSVFNEMLIPEAIAVTLLPAMKKVNMVVAISGPILIFAILKLALIHSNRIIGPIPRLEKELDKAIAGDYTIRVKARDKDELSSFINKINLLLEKIQERDEPGRSIRAN
ncbi:MAG: hypothetical protein A2987_00895 [Omnitrophica bacterium RIFCSPLOWO2_01_FULL_45_10]|nr:MAG: hypothetical protein A2987_00895 [Omnitrophica bacterium RIFCSPLOWO2_01_FULL_45_10]